MSGALIAIVLAAATVWFAGGDTQPSPNSAPAAPAATGRTVVPEVAESEITGSPSASPSSSPTAKPSARPSLRPIDLVAGLHTSVRGLVQDGQLDRDGGEDLAKRLREAGEKLADGEVDKARDKLAEFGKKMAKLREESKLSSTGYQNLAAGLAQLMQTLPSR
ncbi:FIMAH domain-containing protein [Micromonospora fulviviridis]|uniref:FIMAH domain-containing protein n=1 Tax=Micromonospora fulviviridis TaxID=47860 RepID=UPI003796D52D